MLISKDIVFIHIPKTAGRSITKRLCDIKRVEYDKRGVSIDYDPIPIHSKASEVKDLMGKDYDSAFKFTIVRNPFDWLVSFYHYGQVNFSYKFGSFEEFVNFVCCDEYRPDVGANWLTAKNTQSSYLDAEVNSIGRFEELDDYWKGLGYNVELEKLNFTHRQHYTHYYNRTLEARVKEKYKEDIEQFYPELI